MHNPPPGNSFENLSGDEAAIFFIDFMRVMARRVDYYNEYDRVVKDKQVEVLANAA